MKIRKQSFTVNPEIKGFEIIFLYVRWSVVFFSLHYVVRIIGKDMNYIWAEKIFFYVCVAERPIMDEMKRILIKSKNGRKCLNQ